MAVSKICTKQGCIDVICMAEHSVSKSSYELYIMDKITEGVIILLRLFSDDSIASLE
jgi:hypothetical protein